MIITFENKEDDDLFIYYDKKINLRFCYFRAGWCFSARERSLKKKIKTWKSENHLHHNEIHFVSSIMFVPCCCLLTWSFRFHSSVIVVRY